MFHFKTLSLYKRDFYSHDFANPVRYIYLYTLFLHTLFCYVRPQIARARRGGQSAKAKALINTKRKEAIKIILK